MTRVVVVGCGIIGAAIAYELSQVSGLLVTVLDRQLPAQAATGAALGVLMGAISQKPEGNSLRMRLTSIQRYNDWVPRLESVTGLSIPFNRQGILRLCFEGEDLGYWKTLAEIRQQQGWRLEIGDRAYLSSRYPYLNLEHVIGAVYSPQDRQLDPTVMTLALVKAATQNGVQFAFNETVLETAFDSLSDSTGRHCQQVFTQNGCYPADWLVIAAGLGSTPLISAMRHRLELRPVLGQAIQVQLPTPLDYSGLQPVITGDDTHLVPLGGGSYWIGATVEFPQALVAPSPSETALEAVRQRAIAVCPALAHATLVRTWSGLRPRPEGRPAPIIERLPGYRNVLLATGHYRNGVLLAPSTAERIRQAIEAGRSEV
ncbi:FAD-dependent oxidoreductase [Leptothermofonsia sichuanensis E412]|uniref:NAD(P)/FAD-dependent oxidoreductase n=1 Tax=Leptothermofonsia sichuanensis TaxID=2917832 RepID=UPI001CA5FAF2|nr:FAD-dependent oxidoreductase [Leptothermofonsia sichuanensis]QZZ21116.1 FAD-dependent oxidoreductase [Leptothermofonsia sichuanensis E412]